MNARPRLPYAQLARDAAASFTDAELTFFREEIARRDRAFHLERIKARHAFNGHSKADH